MFMAMMVAGRAEAGVAFRCDSRNLSGRAKQVQLAVTNNDENSTYLIQSWVENADGVKDGRFIVTPPLFAMKGKKRIPYVFLMQQITNCHRIGKVYSG